jgi:hypothetical protein
MLENQSLSLEKALTQAEIDAASNLKAAQVVVSALKKYCSAVRLGKIKEIQTIMSEVEES